MELKKTTRFLWISLIELLILCIGVFGWLTFFMVKQNEDSIGQVGQIYMSEVSRQLKLHFPGRGDCRTDTSFGSGIWGRTERGAGSEC